MASRSDDDSVTMSEEPVVRRTRSGRAVKSVSTPGPKTRGRKKVSVSEEVSEEEEVKQPEVKEFDPELSENSNGMPHIVEEESTNDNLQFMDMSGDQQFLELANDRQSPIAEDFLNNLDNSNTNSGDNFYSGVVEENVNSFGSEMDPDEENVDNQIIEISGGTTGPVSNDAHLEMECNEFVEETIASDDQDGLCSLDSSLLKDETEVSSGPFETSAATDDKADSVEDTPSNTDNGADGLKVEEETAEESLDDTLRESTLDECDTSMELNKSLEDALLNTSEDIKEDPDTEMVSEDELPAPPKAKVPEDAEEVSDDELPGPKLAELPADTEVVSEDELPTVKAAKRKHEDESGYDPSSPTGARESSNSKRPALNSSPEIKEEKEEKEKKSSKVRKLPELDKYWKAVHDDPGDFTGWTYLLQYVDQENEIEPAREAYDAFLAHYPYCYGYWRKYADYEKRKGNKKKCEEVFERGLRAIPLSVDLWLHFLTYQKATYGDDEFRIREQFVRALEACGLEFRSDRLWEGFIKWESEGKRYRNVMEIYDKLLATPTFGYTSHFDSFQEFVSVHQPPVILSREEFLAMRAVSRTDKNAPVDSNIPPGEDESDDNMRNDEECEAIRELIVASRRKVHKQTVAEVTARWTYEEGIKRPYFHVKPLERCQLNNWKDYLDYETQHGTKERVLILYERCLIACALYEEFWLRLIRYLELQHDDKYIIAHTRDVFERACTVHHPDKPTLHLLWAAFEENYNAHNKAAEILIHIEKTCPNVLQIAYRRINLERRRGDLDKCTSLFEHYIQTFKSKSIVAGLVIKYARFCHKIQDNMSKAIEVLKSGIERDPGNPRLSLQLIDLYMQREDLNVREIVAVMDTFLAREPEIDQRVLFAQRKLEFLEDFGTADSLQEAQRYLQQALAKAKKKESKRDSSPSKKSKDNSSAPPLPPTNSYQSTNSSQYSSPYSSGQSASAQSSAYGSYAGHGGYNQGYAQSGSEYPPYQWGQYSQGQYSGYGAWGSYPNYY